MRRLPSTLPPTQQVQRHLLTTIVAAAWITTHRYGGIWHDGALYAAQALFRQSPSQFDGDLFFAFGSQDSFSLFGPIYAFFIEALDLYTASFALMIASQVFWLTSAAFLAGRLCAFPANWWALLLLATLPREYGSDNIFAYAETFVTARVFSEAAALFAIGIMLRGSPYIATAVLLFSAMLHPVMAFPAIVTTVVVLASNRLAVALTLLGFATTLILIAAPGLPWTAVAPMDADWYRISVSRSPFVFVDRWSYEELAGPVYWASVLLMAAAATSNRIVARCYRATVFAGMAGFALSILTLIQPVALLVQMQPWRAAWFVKVIAIVAMTELIRSSYREPHPGNRIACALMVASGLALDHWGAPIALALGVCYPLIGNSKRFALLAARWQWHLIVLIIVASLPETALLARDFWSASSEFAADLASGEFPPKSFYLDARPILVAAIAGTAMLAATSARPLPGGKLLPALGAYLSAAVAVLAWSIVFTPATRYLTPPKGLTIELIDAIPAGSTTYFENGHAILWFNMKRASYASHQQAAGVIFSRGTAIEAERRLEALAPLGTRDTHLRWQPSNQSLLQAETAVTAEALRKACEDPVLGQIIVRQREAGGSLPLPRVTFSLIRDPARPYALTHWLYSCTDIRNSWKEP